MSGDREAQDKTARIVLSLSSLFASGTSDGRARWTDQGHRAIRQGGNVRRIRLQTFFVITTLAILFGSCAPLPDPDELAMPRFQAGGKQSAAFCGRCHADTYQQWSLHSRHALATKSRSFLRGTAELTENIILGRFIDEDMCYSCHGDKKVNEGINCESCHGAVLPGVPIETTHIKKYTPRLREMRKPDFCAHCHQARVPVTDVNLTTLYDEWKQSSAAKKGQTCQHCHMAKAEDTPAYHGFKSAVRNAYLYKGQLHIGKIAHNSQRLRLQIENRITGHSIPASGATRVLALELKLKNEKGVIIHDDVRRFFKHFAMLPVIGGIPYMLIENSQLRSGEKRVVRFDLPAGVYQASTKLSLALRMHEVADRYEGDIKRAHWSSKPIVQKDIKINHRDCAKYSPHC